MSVRISYWDKNKKKNVYKTVSIKKFGGDREAALTYLNDWKIKNTESLLTENNKIESVDNILPEVPIIQNENDQNSEIKLINIADQVKRTPFKLNIAPLNETGTTTVIFGASKSGKTTLLKKIYNDYYSKDDVICILIADNVFNNKIYNDLDNKIIKMDFFDTDFIKSIHRIQKRTKNKYAFAFFIDDIICEKYNKELLKMFLTMRNAKISTIMLLQSVKLLSKNERFNGNNFIFKPVNNQEARDETVKMFLSGYPPFYGLSFNDKSELFKLLTTDYAYIYLDALNNNISFHNRDSI